MSEFNVKQNYLEINQQFILLISYIPGFDIDKIKDVFTKDLDLLLIELKPKEKIKGLPKTNSQFNYSQLKKKINDEFDAHNYSNDIDYNDMYFPSIAIIGHTFPKDKLMFNYDCHIHISVNNKKFMELNPKAPNDYYKTYNTQLKNNTITKYINFKEGDNYEDLKNEIFLHIINQWEKRIYGSKYETYKSDPSNIIKTTNTPRISEISKITSDVSTSSNKSSSNNSSLYSPSSNKSSTNKSSSNKSSTNKSSSNKSSSNKSSSNKSSSNKSSYSPSSDKSSNNSSSNNSSTNKSSNNSSLYSPSSNKSSSNNSSNNSSSNNSSNNSSNKSSSNNSSTDKSSNKSSSNNSSSNNSSTDKTKPLKKWLKNTDDTTFADNLSDDSTLMKEIKKENIKQDDIIEDKRDKKTIDEDLRKNTLNYYN